MRPVAGARRHVAAERLADEAGGRRRHQTGGRVGADSQHQRIEQHVFGLDAQPGRLVEDVLGHFQPRFGRGGDAVVVHAQRDHCRAMLGDDGQHSLELGRLAVDRVDQRAPAHGLQPGLQRRRVRRINAHGQVNRVLHQAHGLRQQGDLIHAGRAHIDIEHGRPSVRLGLRVARDAAQVAGLQLGAERLAPGRVDALADHDDWRFGRDDDFGRWASQDSLHDRIAPRSAALILPRGRAQA